MAPQTSPLKRTIVDEEEEGTSRKKGPGAQGNAAEPEHVVGEDGTGTMGATEQPMAIDE